MKICVYTCITGGYDKLLPIPPAQNPELDFICFTEEHHMEYLSGNWSIRPLPSELGYLSKVKQQRIVKICPHRYLDGYDASLWIDGNVRIVGDAYTPFSKCDLSRLGMYVRRHPSRNCIYAESRTVVNMHKDRDSIVSAQMDRYRNEGFPERFGLHETGIILRRHGDRGVERLCNMWAKEVLDGSHRDQLSFDYCRWKTGLDIGDMYITDLSKDKDFRLSRHNHSR